MLQTKDLNQQYDITKISSETCTHRHITIRIVYKEALGAKTSIKIYQPIGHF
jgi:hypothetical protein